MKYILRFSHDARRQTLNTQALNSTQTALDQMVCVFHKFFEQIWMEICPNMRAFTLK